MKPLPACHLVLSARVDAAALAVCVQPGPQFIGSAQQRDEIAESVEYVYASRARVVILFAGSLDVARTFLAASWRRGVRVLYLGTDSWIFPALVESDGLFTTEDADAVALAVQGALGTAPHMLHAGARYEAFLAHWRTAPAVNVSGLGCEGACRETPSWAGQYAYDATRRAHRAWLAALAAGDDPRNLSNGALLRAIRAVDLPGGLVSNRSLDQRTGEPTDGSYDIVQFQCATGTRRQLVTGPPALHRARSTPLSTVRTVHVGTVHGSDVEVPRPQAPPLAFGCGMAAGSIPRDGSEASAAASRVVDGDWTRGERNTRGEAIVELRNVFDEPLEPLTDEDCSALALHVLATDEVTTERGAGGVEPLFSSATLASTQAGSMRALNSSQPRRLCRLPFVYPDTVRVYKAHALLDGVAIAAGAVTLRVVASPAVTPSSPAFVAPLAIGLGFLLLVLLSLLSLFAGWRLHLWCAPQEGPLGVQRSRSRQADEETKSVLALFCNPQVTRVMATQHGIRPLALGQEIKHLLRALPIETVAIEPAATLIDAQEALRRHQPRVLTFSGHSMGSNLVFEDARGRIDTSVDGQHFAKMIFGQLSQPSPSTPASAPLLAARASIWWQSRSLPKGRQPGELAGFKPLMDPAAHVRHMEHEHALKDKHGVVLRLGSREEAIGHLKRMARPARSSNLPHLRKRTLSKDLTSGEVSPTSVPRIKTPVDDMQLELTSRSSEWRQLASWGGFRRAHKSADAHSVLSPPPTHRRIPSIPSLNKPTSPLLSSDLKSPCTRADAASAVRPQVPPKSLRVLQRLEVVVLCGCDTEPIARQLLDAAQQESVGGGLEILCWASVVEDSAARAFSMGVYASIAARARIGISAAATSQPASSRRACMRWRRKREESAVALPMGETAFWAGCKTFAENGFRFGNPKDFLHRPGHPHMSKPEFISCPGCTPPVHGMPLLLRITGGALHEKRPPVWEYTAGTVTESGSLLGGSAKNILASVAAEGVTTEIITAPPELHLQRAPSIGVAAVTSMRA